jgi:hypothetical protein
MRQVAVIWAWPAGRIEDGVRVALIDEGVRMAGRFNSTCVAGKLRDPRFTTAGDGWTPRSERPELGDDLFPDEPNLRSQIG